jgi:hypothetical protein
LEEVKGDRAYSLLNHNLNVAWLCFLITGLNHELLVTKTLREWPAALGLKNSSAVGTATESRGVDGSALALQLVGYWRRVCFLGVLLSVCIKYPQTDSGRR